MCHVHGGLKPIPNTPGTRGNEKKKALRYLIVIYTRLSLCQTVQTAPRGLG